MYKSRVAEIIQEVSSYKNTVKLHPNFVFRGQTNSEWSLSPSLTRILNDRKFNKKQALQLERETINKFAVSARQILPIEAWLNLGNGLNLDFMGWMVIMQHFSAPTRKLDWTISPLVGLYFACNNHFNKDGKLWIADWNRISTATEEFSRNLNINESFFQANDYDNLVFTHAIFPNERIEAQQGRFSICTNPLIDHKNILEDNRSLKSIEIPKEVKSDILIELYNMNINSRTLFPGIDGLGKSISEYGYLWDENSKII